ncbi:hypothetical protein M409DRAFT_68277 [Zasmidium cellare ATCC 36951]|uniref:Uncharacterized protein n=1 Tax=Zasmidium cellare ATCC 36951 TaxID=1080233 RepID=A0A6A6C9F6_ZASCE|nr:uncharacterized protein M409DRAFT_68277 [Zasmidium cellare ATCC 36951]KAF2163671.1 hypothetical protein M409DRAFT_68277 [Zasmidium cellare ATCC 36951]
MSSPSEWSDRRGLFQKGKEVHEPGRRLSGGAGGVIDAVRRASTSSTSEKGSFVSNPLSNDPASPASPTSQRRRSSAASGDLFGNLQQHKRGSDGYDERKASHTDQLAAGGAVSGWFNKTFRGVNPVAEDKSGEKRGVME